MLDPKQIRNVAVIAHDGAGKTANADFQKFLSTVRYQ